MSWTDFYRRRDAIDLVLARAQRNQAFDDIASDVFGGSDELALALQYKWSQQVHGRVAVALAEAEHAPDVDHVAAVATAWRTTARRHPELRRILDEHVPAGDEFAAAVRAEQRMLALAAGLADAGEPPAATARIGAAFQALIRTTPDQPDRRTNPVEQLFRRLVASS
jgi:hypothetical protein